MTMRIAFFLTAASALSLPLSGPAFAAPPAKTSAARATDWTRAIADTGVGWKMGNPNAPTRLVEYGSFNCPHCAAFEKAAMPAIRKLVAAGKISFEFRPKQLFPHDPSATLLAQCVGKEQLFAFTSDYMASAPAVLEKLRASYKADPSVIDDAGDLGTAALAKTVARIGEMAPIAARHGLSAQRAEACLGDAKMIARVEDNEAAATQAGVTGTPTFFIDGRRVELDAVKALGIPVDL